MLNEINRRAWALLAGRRNPRWKDGSGKDWGRLLPCIQSHIEELPPIRSVLHLGGEDSRLVDWVGKLNDATRYRFDGQDLTKLKAPAVDLVIVTDVLNLLSTNEVNDALVRIRSISRNVYMNVALPRAASFGFARRTHAWWRQKLLAGC